MGGSFVWDPVYYGPLIDVPNVGMGELSAGANKSQFVRATYEQNQAALITGDPRRKQMAGWLARSQYLFRVGSRPIQSGSHAVSICHMPANTE